MLLSSSFYLYLTFSQYHFLGFLNFRILNNFWSQRSSLSIKGSPKCNISKIMKWKFMIFLHCTTLLWDLFNWEAWIVLDKKKQITKGSNSKFMKRRVIVLVHCTSPLWNPWSLNSFALPEKWKCDGIMDRQSKHKMRKGKNSILFPYVDSTIK